MGSLMAGWDSSFKDPQAVKYQRNKSLTKLDIDAYWKSKKTTEEEHLRDISGTLNQNQDNIYNRSGERLWRSSSLPLTDRKESSVNNSERPDGEKFIKTNCWWTRSNSAFLNEPPVIAMDGPSYKYASQSHLTELGSSKTVNNSAISA